MICRKDVSYRAHPCEIYNMQSLSNGPGVQRAQSSDNKVFFEPVMRVRLVVESIDLDVSRAPVQSDGFPQRSICLEPNHTGSGFPGVSLQLAEKPPP